MKITPKRLIDIGFVKYNFKQTRCEYYEFHLYNPDGIGAITVLNDLLGVNLTSTCSRCGKEVMQDSQGNWF